MRRTTGSAGHGFSEHGSYIDGMPCRLCTANDEEALVESLAADLWESRRHGTLDDYPWNQPATIHAPPEQVIEHASISRWPPLFSSQ